MKRILKKIGFVVFQLLITLTIAEFFCRFWLANYGDGLQRARRILTPHTAWGWVQKSNLNTTFEGQAVRTDTLGFRNASVANNTPITTLILGPSSAFGWGVSQDQSYSEILNRHQLRVRGERVWNASVIGFSSHQGMSLLKDILAMENSKSVKQAVIAYGINDLDRFRFFDGEKVSDKVFFSKKQNSNDGNPWSDWALTDLVYRVRQEMDMWVHCGLSSLPERRVGWQEFENNMLSMIQLLRERNIQPYIINTTFLAQVEDSKKQSEQSAELYLQSIAAHEKGNCQESRDLFARAKLLEVGRIVEDVKTLNQLIQKLATSQAVPVIDATILESSAAHFYDPVHPSSSGHQRLGDLLIKELEK